MTPAETNRRLALAIGCRPEHISTVMELVFVSWISEVDGYLEERKFDYRDPETIYPIAERYKMFPVWAQGNGLWLIQNSTWTWHTCPRACIALAVIEAKERGLI